MLRHRLLKAFALSLLVACARDGEQFNAAESSIIPNSEIFELGHDGDTYRRIADAFASRGLDMHVDLTTFAPGWPLTDAKATVLNRQGTPMIYASYGYFHTGVDVMRSAAAVSKDVVAPVDGLAMVFDWSGNRVTDVTSPYATIVGIYDPVSHVVTELLHVAATAALVKSTDPVTVKKGEVIGTLASAPVASAPDALRLANTQIAFIDGENKKLLNPARYLADYKDTAAPELKSGYVSDEAGQVSTELSSGKLDFLVEVADRDDASGRNFEVSAIAYKVTDQDGKVLAESAKCELDSLYDSIASGSSYRARDVIDFGSAIEAEQVSGAWPNSDVDNADRTFRYALTNLKVAADGRCSAIEDASGFLDVADSVGKVTVSVKLWDAKGNESTSSFEVKRAGFVEPEPDAGAADDAGDAPNTDSDAAVDTDAGDAGTP